MGVIFSLAGMAQANTPQFFALLSKEEGEPNLTSAKTDNEVLHYTQWQQLADSIPVFHKVAPKENLYRVSLIYKVSIFDIKKWNGLYSNHLTIGQELIVGYKKKAAQPTAPVYSKKDDYMQLILMGNQAISDEDYSLAKGYYQSALVLMPDETYPQGMLEKINRSIQAKQQATLNSAPEITAPVISADESGATEKKPTANEPKKKKPAKEKLMGYKKNFFLKSKNGKFLLKTPIHLQLRYVNNFDDPDNDIQNWEWRRVKVRFLGHLFSKNFKYNLMIALGSKNKLKIENSYLEYKFAKYYKVRVGQFNGTLLRENNVSSRFHQTVDRSAVNKNFTLGFIRGIAFLGKYKKWQWKGTLHLGRQAVWGVPRTAVGVAFRAQWVPVGKLKDFRDFAAWKKNKPGVLLGYGIDFENFIKGGNINRFVTWTVDASAKLAPFNAMVAIIMRHGSIERIENPKPNQIGLVTTASVFIVPKYVDVFARWEMLNYDGYSEIGDDMKANYRPYYDRVNLFTFGVNTYIVKHNFKITTDFMLAPNGLYREELGLGLIKTADNVAQKVIRVQLNILL